MSKKQMTPEMRAEKLERKKTKRGIFGKTFINAFGWFISIVLVFTVALLAFKPTPTIKTVVTGGVQQGGSKSGGSQQQKPNQNGGAQQEDGGTAKTDGGAAKTDGGAGGADSASAVEAINAAMAKAAVANYKWQRTGKITKPVNVGGATDTLNKLISGVDPNANLDSVIGGFLGAKGDTQELTLTAGKPEGNYYHWEQYALKASSLKAEDLQNLNVSGNKYSFDLETTKNPEADSSGFSRFSNDFVTIDMVNTEVKQMLSVVTITDMDADYGPCHVEMTIEDGKLTSMKYSYDAVVNSLGVKVTVIKANGTGGIHVEAEYKDFSY